MAQLLRAAYRIRVVVEREDPRAEATRRETEQPASATDVQEGFSFETLHLKKGRKRLDGERNSFLVKT